MNKVTSENDKFAVGFIFELKLKLAAYLAGKSAKQFLETTFLDVFRHEITDLVDMEVARSKERKNCGKYQATLM